MATRTNENNMFTEKKMHIFKSIIVSEHGFEHVSYVTRYIFGEVTEEENKRNGGVGYKFSSHLFHCDAAKRGKHNFGKLGIKNIKILEVEGNLYLSLFSPHRG